MKTSSLKVIAFLPDGKIQEYGMYLGGKAFDNGSWIHTPVNCCWYLIKNHQATKIALARVPNELKTKLLLIT